MLFRFVCMHLKCCMSILLSLPNMFLFAVILWSVHRNSRLVMPPTTILALELIESPWPC